MVTGALTFFGEVAGNTRISVLPAHLDAAAIHANEECMARLSAGCAGLPELLRRAWLWSGLAIHQGGPNAVMEAILQWSHTSKPSTGKQQARGVSLRAAESFHWQPSHCNADSLLDFYRRTIDPDVLGFREQSLRFGCIASNEVFSHALHWQEVPAYIDNLCSFLRALPRLSLHHIVTVFRQLVLIHPFIDGNGRFARAFTTSLCAAADWPRYLLLPALVAFRASASSRNAYASALATSNPERFADYVLSLTEEILGALRERAAEARMLQEQLAECLKPAALGRRLVDRLIAAPSISTAEFARISQSGERNALRWLNRLSDQGVCSLQAEQWLWTPALAYYQDLDQSIRAMLDSKNPPM